MRRGYADTALGQVHYITEGNGPTIFLMGPTGRSSRIFWNLIPLLAGRFRVFALDMLGTGNSDPLPADLDIPRLGKNVIEVMDALGLAKVSFFGLHTGNKIGTAVAANWPSRIDNFILCGQTHSIVPSTETRQTSIGDRLADYTGEDLDHGRGILKPWAVLGQRLASLWWNETFFSSGNVAGAIEFARRRVLDEIQAFGSIPELYRMNFAYALEADLPRIAVRTLVIEVVAPWEEQRYGRQGAIVQNMIPGAHLATLEVHGYKLGLEDRAQDLADLILNFCG
jgi:pimeloyl-ACP methyl ester carboxylesterase